MAKVKKKVKKIKKGEKKVEKVAKKAKASGNVINIRIFSSAPRIVRVNGTIEYGESHVTVSHRKPRTNADAGINQREVFPLCDVIYVYAPNEGEGYVDVVKSGSNDLERPFRVNEFTIDANGAISAKTDDGEIFAAKGCYEVIDDDVNGDDEGGKSSGKKSSKKASKKDEDAEEESEGESEEEEGEEEAEESEEEEGGEDEEWEED